MTPVRLLLLAGFVLSPTPVQAQAPQGPPGWFQVEAFYHRVSEDFGDWKGFGAHLVAPAGRRDIWYADAVVREAFDDRGAYVSVGNRHLFGRWFTLAAVGGGTGDFIHPDLRADLTVGRAFGQVAALTGVTYVNAKRGYEDVALSGSLAAYFSTAVVETGVRSNWSWPEAVQATRGFGAVTFGREGRSLVTLRGSTGGEGYQLTGEVSTERRFRSSEASLAWRQWLRGRMGFLIHGDWYDNPFYTRIGVTVGVFRAW